MDATRIYAVHYRRGTDDRWRIVGALIPRGRNRAGVRWWVERRGDDGAWVQIPAHETMFNPPPRDHINRLLRMARNDARLLGYKVGGEGTGLLPYLLPVYTL